MLINNVLILTFILTYLVNEKYFFILQDTFVHLHLNFLKDL